MLVRTMLLLGVLLSAVAQAAEITVRWQAPTENMDGAPAVLSGFRLFYGETEPTTQVNITDPNARSYRLTGLPDDAAIVVELRAVGDDGQVSNPSNRVTFNTGTPPEGSRPKPPRILTCGDGFEPLSVSANGRYFLEGAAPWQWYGDTAWLLNTIPAADALAYLDARAAQGVNVIQGPILARHEPPISGATPEEYGLDRNGERPFLSTNPPALNPVYWSVIDDLVSEASARGLRIAMPLLWGPGVDRLFTVDESGNTQAREFGRQVAARYAGCANVIYFVAGEYQKIAWETAERDRVIPSAAEIALLRALAEGVRAGADPAQLVLMHPDGAKSSAEHFHADPWMSANTWQTSSSSTWSVRLWRQDRVRQPLKPYFDAEGDYENRDLLDAWSVRRQAYLSLLGGAAGITYGAGRVWHFAEGWQEDLTLPGITQVRIALETVRAWAWPSIEPLENLVVSGRGNLNQNTYVLGSRSVDRRTALVYASHGATFSLDLTKLVGSTFQPRWINPRTGTATVLGNVSRGASVQFNPPNSPAPGEDWLLILRAI